MGFKFKIEIYRDNDGDFRWRVRAVSNRKIVGDSAEGYRRKVDCVQAINRLFGAVRENKIDLVDLTLN